MKKRIYMAGSGGMLGEAFHEQFKDDYHLKCTDKDVNEDWLSFLDFRDFDTYEKAFIRERQLKKWNRAWKEELIISMNKEWKDLAEAWAE